MVLFASHQIDLLQKSEDSGCMEVTLSGHGAYQLVYHVVWVTKYRRKILNPGMIECLQSLMPKLARSMSGVIVEQMGFDRNRVHFVMVVPHK